MAVMRRLAVLAIFFLSTVASAQTTTTYRGVTVREPAPTGAAGLAWQNNFKELADRVGPIDFTATTSPDGNSDFDAGSGFAIGSLVYDTVGDKLWWCSDNTEGAPKWICLTTPIADVRAFGAIGDGIADDTTAIQAAMDACDQVYIPTGTYLCAGLTVNDGQRIFGDGPSAILRFRSGESGYLIECENNSVNISDVALNGGLTVTQAATEIQGDRSGLHVSSISTFTIVRNVNIYGFSNAGLAINGDSVNRNGTPSIIGCALYCNYFGIDTGPGNTGSADIGGEYVSITGTSCRKNRYGLVVNSGSLLVTGSHFDDNGYGVYVTDAFNNGHGSLTGSTINHCTVRGVLIDGASNGFCVTGCQSWYSDWEVIDSTGVGVFGNVFGGTTTITLAGGGPGMFVGNYFRGNPTFIRADDGFAVENNRYGADSSRYVGDTKYMTVDAVTNYASAARLGAGTITDPLLPVHADGAAAAPPTSGTTPAGFFRFGGAGGYSIVMDGGVYNSSPYAVWLRVSDRTNLALTYPLVLQPNGGPVGVDESDPDYKLDVNGPIGFAPGSSVQPADNGDVTFALTSDTTFVVRARGSDGVVRESEFTLTAP